MLSLSASFASDDVADVIAIDDATTEEPIAIEEDTSVVVGVVDSSNVVTNDTVYNYFDEGSGTLLSNVTSDELVFDGTFENLNVSTLIVDRAIKLTGENAIFNNISLSIVGDNVSVSGFTINQGNQSMGIFVSASDVTISNSEINFADKGIEDSFGIYVMDSKNFKLLDNVINYVGNSNGYLINNAVFISNASNSEIRKNKIYASLVSAAVGWEEVPPGSGNWEATRVISEGVVIKDTDDAVFAENDVTVIYGDVAGSYDTIYAVSVKNSDNTVISNNTINALGHTYIYGLQVNGDNFTVEENNITVESDNYYANGIDIEGPATGNVNDNVIDVTGVESAYAVYSGMNGAAVSANYTGNQISASAYNVFGFSLGDVISNLKDNYIDLNGNYTTGVAYRGSFINATENKIVLTSSEEGNLTVWEGFGVEAVGIKVIKGSAVLSNNTIATSGKGVSLTGNETNAYLTGNFINVVANADKDAYAIYAKDMGLLYVIDNNVDYQGATMGTGINNALYIDNATSPMIVSNEFDLDLVSSYVPWAEVPAGSGNWVSSPISEGIVIANTDDVIFAGNVIDASYIDVVGSYDTIYAVDFKNSDNAQIEGNKIDAKGHTYIYGLIISGDNFIVEENDITTESDNYYANGIDIEGPATGVVKDNSIDVTGVESAYAIYSGMNGQNVSAVYQENKIRGDAYNVFGMSLGDVESVIVDNHIVLLGNYTTAIAFKGSNLTVDSNLIIAAGNNEGNLSVWEAFGVETIGIKVANGEATITNNNIVTTGDYAIDLKDNVASVHENYLIGDKFVGDESVNNSAKADVYNNNPSRASSIITITEVTGDINIVGVLKDSNGYVLANKVITYSFNGTNSTVTTDENGTFEIANLTNGEVNIAFDGELNYKPVNTTITLKDIAPVIVKVESAFNITDRAITIYGYAVDGPAGEQGIYYATTLIDENGNPIPNVYIEFAVNNKIYNRTTYENGSFVPYKLNMVRAGRYTMAFNFAGDENYTNAFACVCVDLDKKPMKIKASDKSYKKSTKTKKYTVTLSTIKGLDGKMYLSPKKVSLTVNGKTYTAKTNSKGQATFKITNLKSKAKYKAKISFEGDKTYESADKTVTLTVK
jgi:uncharacterized protein YacL (UPF0231 family)